MSLTFKKFTKKTFSATQKKWSKDAENGMGFPAEVERLFSWASDKLDHKPGTEVFYGVFEEDNDVAIAISEVVVTQKNIRDKWVKMLRLHLAPSLDANHDSAMDAFAQSMLGALLLQFEHQAHTLKVYGRTVEQLTLLKALVKSLNSPEITSIDAKIEGKFLSIKLK